MFRRALLLLGLAAVGATLLSSAAVAGSTPSDRTLPPTTRFMVRTPDTDALKQGIQLALHGHLKDALSLAKMLATPQAVWLANGTPQDVSKQVKTAMASASLQHAVPVFVVYFLPFRDCGQYSAGGAHNTAEYLAWVGAVAKAIGNGKAVVLLEPDGLGIIPWNHDLGGNLEWCQPDVSPAGETPANAAQARYDQITGALSLLEAKPNTTVYLDGTHPAWLNVAEITSRLIKGNVAGSQGFFLNASNYQYTQNAVAYGTWISYCIAQGGTNCPDQYWNGGPHPAKIADLLGEWTGVSLSPYGVWSDSSDDPALNTSGEDVRYAGNGATPTTHFVVDTGRNALGPNNMSTYAGAPFNQPAGVISTLASGNWCNNPNAGLGLRPTANTGVPLVDAYLWVKTPGESDGSCNAAGGARAWDYSIYNPWNVAPADQPSFDPLWGEVDPAAGAWFPDLTVMLLHNAQPPLG